MLRIANCLYVCEIAEMVSEPNLCAVLVGTSFSKPLLSNKLSKTDVAVKIQSFQLVHTGFDPTFARSLPYSSFGMMLCHFSHLCIFHTRIYNLLPFAIALYTWLCSFVRTPSSKCCHQNATVSYAPLFFIG